MFVCFIAGSAGSEDYNQFYCYGCFKHTKNLSPPPDLSVLVNDDPPDRCVWCRFGTCTKRTSLIIGCFPNTSFQQFPSKKHLMDPAKKPRTRAFTADPSSCIEYTHTHTHTYRTEGRCGKVQQSYTQRFTVALEVWQCPSETDTISAPVFLTCVCKSNNVVVLQTEFCSIKISPIPATCFSPAAAAPNTLSLSLWEITFSAVEQSLSITCASSSFCPSGFNKTYEGVMGIIVIIMMTGILKQITKWHAEQPREELKGFWHILCHVGWYGGVWGLVDPGLVGDPLHSADDDHGWLDLGKIK